MTDNTLALIAADYFGFGASEIKTIQEYARQTGSPWHCWGGYGVGICDECEPDLLITAHPDARLEAVVRHAPECRITQGLAAGPTPRAVE